MSIDDEIARKRRSMQAAVDAEARRKADADRLNNALSKAHMSHSTPIIRMPSEDLRRVITETMPRMNFNAPKIIKNMPDGTTRVRPTNGQEWASDHSFDVVVARSDDKHLTPTAIWFFRNGSVAYTYNGNQLDNLNVSTSVVREKIIETIASAQVVTPRTNNTTGTSGSSSGGCYIATAVYGSYDCPEVWILRRYRDNVLKPSLFGRLFIKTYYAVSPVLVKHFGKTEWFRAFWRKRLDHLRDSLKEKGFSDRPYDDC